MTEAIGVAGSQMPAHLFDGYHVHRAALAHGLNVLALPRQVLLAGRQRAVPSEVSFAHGVPESSTVAAVTFAQDRRLRRAMVERAGVAVPKGATFSWRTVRSASTFAEEIGYPVVVKEGQGENPSRAIRGVRSAQGVASAFHELRLTRPEDRSPGSNPLIAGYAATRLGFDIDDEGNEVAPLRTRFLVEKQVPGQVVRTLVCGDDAVVSVLLDDSTGLGVLDVTQQCHPRIREIAVAATQATPGLALGTVDIVSDDYRSDGGEALVTEVSERPRLETYVTAGELLGEIASDAIIRLQARLAGFDLSSTRTHVSGIALVEGLRDAEATAEELPVRADALGLSVQVVDIDDVLGNLRLSMSGTPSTIAAYGELLLSGDLTTDRASSIEFKSEDENE
ncbi:hypothetical protein [Brevibacterium jeotgali]|uniref:Carbamoyl-phosphate synthase L chain, ATP binding domain n=1 Tax=Brevibacterium jeotgali TaxID=1262550 RepID=A0A2H1L8I9_9MICO|nr:hypothetical protein [Brevibacterium jeotgali]TWB98834.1 carbamoyl-phosphate synthase L subunit-like protein [Brevibacterium jeotgali]SMY13192.1 Carbamoyl-phosphate synthase L chain, ATP binding domain [Brevibacterium jeotgali]